MVTWGWSTWHWATPERIQGFEIIQFRFLFSSFRESGKQWACESLWKWIDNLSFSQRIWPWKNPNHGKSDENGLLTQAFTRSICGFFRGLPLYSENNMSKPLKECPPSPFAMEMLFFECHISGPHFRRANWCCGTSKIHCDLHNVLCRSLHHVWCCRCILTMTQNQQTQLAKTPIEMFSYYFILTVTCQKVVDAWECVRWSVQVSIHLRVWSTFWMSSVDPMHWAE